MGPLRILVVDDEPPIVELVRGYLAREGWAISTAADGQSALARVREDRPDVVVLDLMLPGMDGVEVCRQVRTFSDAFVIMLTARSEEVDRLIGLAVGADDYVTKPFSPRELVARIKAVLRRGRAAPAGHAPTRPLPPGLHVDRQARQVVLDGRRVELTRTEFEILAMLAASPGTVVERQVILTTVWGPEYVDDHVVDVHVANLRRKLGDTPETPRIVETVRGVGYRLAAG